MQYYILGINVTFFIINILLLRFYQTLFLKYKISKFHTGIM